MNLHGTSLLAGGRGRAGGRTFTAIDPATGAILAPPFHEAAPEEVSRAMDAAGIAFNSYRTCAPEQRARFLEAIAVGIEALGDTLVARATAETGLPAARIIGERGRTCTQLRLFANLVREGSWVDARIDTALPDRQPLPRPDVRRMLQPLGPVVVFGSSNFPLAFSTAGGDTASALAAGCSVVVKAHRAHPGTSELVGGAIVKAAADCDLPPGVFSMIHGGGSTVGIAMVRHPAAAAVGFTGSQVAGRALFDAAAARPAPIPVFAEMSSLNPVFILPDALRTRGRTIAQGLFASFTQGVGQFCTKPGLVFAPRGEATDAFIAELSKLVSEAAGGTMLSGDILRSFEEHRGGLTATVGVTTLAMGVAGNGAGSTARPSVAVTQGARFLASPGLATEAFGPFTLVIVTQDVAEMAACARALQGQLTATFQASDTDLASAAELLSIAERMAGRVIVNGFPTGVEVCHAMNHGGPYPATSDARFTSVGSAAILRFARPVCLQGFSDFLLPPELRNANPRNIQRMVNGELTRAAL